MSKYLSIFFVVLTLSACGGGGGGNGGGNTGGPTPPSLFSTCLDCNNEADLNDRGIVHTDATSGIEFTSPLTNYDFENPVLGYGYSDPVTYEWVDGEYSYYQALSYANDTDGSEVAKAKSTCEALTTGGNTDWKLATIYHIESLKPKILEIIQAAEIDTVNNSDDQFSNMSVILPQPQSISWSGFTVRHNNYDGTFNYNSDNPYSAICVRNDASIPQVSSLVEGRWAAVSDTSIVNISSDMVGDALQHEVVDANRIRMTLYGQEPAPSYAWGMLTKTYVRAGIANVKLKGELKSFTDVAASKSAATKAGTQKALFAGDIGLIIGDIGCYNVRQATVTNPAGQLVPATTVGGCDDAYVDQTAGGSLDIGTNPWIVAPTGPTEIIVSDGGGNTATFSVGVIGEETDLGVLNIPDSAIEYNFKSTVSHLNDYVYFSDLTYVKNVKVCNTGTADIDGMTMAFAVDAADTTLVKSFTHNYNGAATSFPAGTCQTVTFTLEFNRPVVDDDVKINIDVTNNFTSTTWNDYVVFDLSRTEPVPLYFASNTKTLNGYLVAPGRNLVKVGFSGFNANLNFIRVPAELDQEYELVLGAANINDADTYMISSNYAPDINKITGFSDVTRYEPDDSYADATDMPFFNGEHISYLAAGDVDTYRIFNLIEVDRQSTEINVGESIVIYLNTDLDPATVDDTTVLLTQNSVPVTATVVYNAITNSITVTPVSTLSVGTATVTVTTAVNTTNSIALPADVSWDVTVATPPAVITTVATIPSPQNGYFKKGDVVYINTGYPDYVTPYDVINKSNPVDIGNGSALSNIQPMTYPSARIVISGNYCYRSDGTNGTRVYDCSNAYSWSLVGTILPTAAGVTSTDVKVVNNTAYVSYYESGPIGLEVFDITDISAPVSLGVMTTTTNPSFSNSSSYPYMVQDGNNLIFWNGSQGHMILDVTNPASMTLSHFNAANISGFNDFDMYLEPVVVPGSSIMYSGQVYSCNTVGVCATKARMIDYSNLSAPALTSSPALGATFNDAEIVGNLLFTVDENHNLNIIDISTPLSPVAVTSFQYSTNASIDTQNTIELDGNYAYVKSSVDNLLYIIDISSVLP